MKRGEIWWVNFDPSQGGKIKKRRPAVIVSNDSSNKFLNRVQVIPLTSNADRLYPAEAYVKVGDRMAKAMADQLTTVAKERLINRMAEISSEDMEGVERAMMIQLGFLKF